MGGFTRALKSAHHDDARSLRSGVQPGILAAHEGDELLVYYLYNHPVREAGCGLIVTNGDQTDTIWEFLARGESWEAALRTRKFEHDGPNWTPRISGLIAPDGSYKMSILKSADAEGSACARYTYEYPGVNGVGHFLHTYVTDGSPIPTFQGEPERVAITGTMAEFADLVWNNLNEANKISLYVRFTDLATGDNDGLAALDNRYT